MKTRILGVLFAAGHWIGASSGAAPAAGTVLWTNETGQIIRQSCSVGSGGVVYLPVPYDALYALTNNGPIVSNKWTFPFATGTPSIGAEGMLYFGVADAQADLYALRPDGTVAWARPFQPEFQSQVGVGAVAIGSDGTLYCKVGPRLYSVSPLGTVNWWYQIDEGGPISPVIGADGTIYVGSKYKKLYAINPDGTQRWTVSGLSDAGAEAPAIGGNGTIYYPAGQLYAFSPFGTNLWTTDYNYNHWFAGAPAIGLDGFIYLNASLLTPLWAVTPSGQPGWSALGPWSRSIITPAVDAGGTLYYCVSNSIWALSPQGQVKWAFTSPDQPSPMYPDLAMTSPIIGPDGTIYVALGTKLFAIVSGTNGPANSPWPMYQQNPRHTGKVEKPVLKQPQKRADANFEFQLYPQQLGLTYTIDSSTNLNTWTSLTSFVATTFPTEVIDLTATNAPFRFYRASSPP